MSISVWSPIVHQGTPNNVHTKTKVVSEDPFFFSLYSNKIKVSENDQQINTDNNSMEIDNYDDIPNNEKHEKEEKSGDDNEVLFDLYENSKEVNKENAICAKCEIREAKNECEQCGKHVCPTCEIKVHGVSVMEFMKENNFLNYTCNTVHN